MADRAVGTATSYPVDRQHLAPCDEIPCHAGDRANSRVYPSRIKYGDPTSPFGGDSIIPPSPLPIDPIEPEPEVPETSIGTVMTSGPTESKVGEIDRYTTTASGNANKTFTWSAVGGQISGSGLSVQVLWNVEGAGSITCSVSSADENVTDENPQADTVNVTIAPETVFSLPSIGDVTFSGPQNPTEKTDASYTANNDGDASGLTYFWSVNNGTIKGSNTSKKVDLTCGNAGNMELTCEVNSSDPDVTDAPQTVASNIPVAVAPVFVGDVVVTGMSTVFIGDEETYECSYTGNIKSPIYRWRLAGIGGEIITFGGLGDSKCGVRSSQPGGYDVICEVDADDWIVADRGASGKISVQVQT